MAGQPLKQKLIRELEQRTRAAFPDEPEATHLDYIEDWQASGKTLNALAEECGFGVYQGEFISRYLRKQFGADQATDRLTRARARGGHALVEAALDVAGRATPEDVNVARLQVQTMQWTAEKWAPRELGVQKGTNVHISFGALHLAALQSHQLTPSTAIEDAIVSDVEIVSAALPSACEPERSIPDRGVVAGG